MKAGWEVKALGELCRIELGSTPFRKSPKLWDKDKTTNNVWLSIADLPLGTREVVNSSKEHVADEASKSMKLVPKGTLMVSFKLSQGRLAFAGCDLRTNEATAALHDLDQKLISNEYLYWFLTFFDWNEAASGDQKIKGKTLNKAKLKAINIILPPLDEQKRIVAVLDAAFEGLTLSSAVKTSPMAASPPMDAAKTRCLAIMP